MEKSSPEKGYSAVDWVAAHDDRKEEFILRDAASQGDAICRCMLTNFEVLPIDDNIQYEYGYPTMLAQK